MSNTYTWEFPSLTTLTSHAGQNNVVVEVHWSLTASDGNNHTATSIGVQYITFEENTSYSAFCYFLYNGSGVGTITTDGGSTYYNTSFDYRLKNIDGIVSNTGHIIDSVNVYTGAFKSQPDKKRHMMIAHELQESLPFAVHGEKDELWDNGEIKPQQVDYSTLVPTMWAEIQSLRKRIAELNDSKQETMEILLEEIKNMKSRISKLENKE
jgi:hypothetical protein